MNRMMVCVVGGAALACLPGAPARAATEPATATGEAVTEVVAMLNPGPAGPQQPAPDPQPAAPEMAQSVPGITSEENDRDAARPTPVPAAPAPAAPAPAQTTARRPSGPHVTFGATGEDFVIDVGMPGATATTLRMDGPEALLSFPHQLPQFDAVKLQTEAASLLESVSVGYDTLLLHLGAGVTLARTDSPEGVRLVLQHAGDEPGTESSGSQPAAPEAGAPEAGGTAEAGSSAGGESQGALRLRLLDAQLLAQGGEFGDARERFKALTTAMPDSPEPLAGLADIAHQTGRWRQADELYQQALQLDPGNPAVAAAIADSAHAQAPRVRTDVEYRQTNGGVGTGSATAVIGGISGQQPVGEGTRVGISLQLAQIDADQVQQPDGSTGSFHGIRQRGELSVQHDFLDGTVVAGALYMTGSTPGGGLRAELPDDSGAWLLRGEYQRTDWDFFQSMIDNGTRDRVAVGRRQRLMTDLTARLEVGGNRYGIEGLSNAASTATVTGEVRLGNLGGVRGLSTAYVLDAEYVHSIATRTSATGQSYNPLSIVNREVHALVLSYAGTWGTESDGARLTYELTGGYGIDRYGRAGPIAAAAVGYNLDSLELGLRTSFVQNIGRSQGTTLIVAASLTWFF